MIKNRALTPLKAVVIIGVLIYASASMAHGDLSERINIYTEAIINFPDSAQLYHQRGTLYRQHGDIQLALIDLYYCKKLNYITPHLRLDLAKALFKAGNYNDALNELEENLCLVYKDVIAQRLKGKILFEQQKYKEAAWCFENVIEYSINTVPENYIEAARAWYLSNTISASCNAVDALNKGIFKLGSLIVLQQEIINIHLKNDDLYDAIETQKKIINNLNRKEHAYYQLALLKQKANMHESAQQDFLLAKEAIELLPIRLKFNKAILALSNNIKEKINQQ